MAKITKIEARGTVLPAKKRVAAYARVSRDSEQLMHSLSSQISYYSSLIQGNPDWEYAGVYADEGISGTSKAGRDAFNRLIADCEAGKIDLILTKSISRFARNTVDLLETVRHLKEIGVEVRFERENIRTLSVEGELLLTILASFAQEESRSLSENVKWAVVKGYQEGKPHSPTRTYGYEWDGEKYVIVPEEAEVVRTVFESYLSGLSLFQIADALNEKGCRSLKDGRFCRASLKDMIQNEIYIGNLLFQKTFSPDVRKRTHNHGEVPMYRVEEAHEPIVSRELFDAVQEERKKRREYAPNKNREITAFSGKVKCGKCGYSCSRRNIPHTKTTEREYAKRWVCNLEETKQQCDARPISEDELRRAAAEVLDADPSDDDALRSRMGEVTVFDDRVEFFLKNGTTKTWMRSFSRRDSCRTCFSGRLFCGDCGAVLTRNTIKKKRSGESIKQWRCRTRRKSIDLCGSRPLPEEELREATISILGSRDNYELRFCCEMEKVLVYKEKVDFYRKDGRIEEWQRE